MTEVDRNLRTAIPADIAARYQITPGVQLEWLASGNHIEVVPVHPPLSDSAVRLQSFDEATARQEIRQTGKVVPDCAKLGRGWTREGIYSRDESR